MFFKVWIIAEEQLYCKRVSWPTIIPAEDLSLDVSKFFESNILNFVADLMESYLWKVRWTPCKIVRREKKYLKIYAMTAA